MPIQKIIQERIGGIKIQIISYLEETLQRKVTYGNISPSFFRNIKIHDLRIHGPAETDEPSIEISQIRIYYRLFALLGQRPIDAVYQIKIENSIIDINAAEDSDLTEIVKNFLASRKNRRIPDILVKAKNLKVRYEIKELSFEVKRLFANLQQGRENTIQVHLRGAFSGKSEQEIYGFSEAETVFNIFGDLAREFETADLRCRLKNFSSNLFSISEQNFRLFYSGDSIQLQKIQDREPIDISAVYDIEKRTGEITVLTEDFFPKRYITLYEYYPQVTPWLGTKISGTVEASYNFENGELEYSAITEIFADNEILPFPVYAEIDARGNRKEVYSERTLVQTERGAVLYSGVINLESFMPSGILQAEDLRLTENHLVNGRIYLQSTGRVMQVQSDLIDLSSTPFRNMKSIISFDPGEINILLQSGVGNNNESELTLEGSFGTAGEKFLQGALQIENCPVALILPLIPGQSGSLKLPRQAESMELSAQAFFTSDFKKVAYVSPFFSLKDPGEEGKFLECAFAGNDRTIEVTNIQGRWDPVYATGAMTIDFISAADFEIDSILTVNGFDYAFTGAFNQNAGLFLEGSYNTKLTLLFHDIGLLFQLETEGIPVGFDAVQGKINLHAYGALSKENELSLYVPAFQIEDGRLGKKNEFTVDCQFNIEERNLHIQNIHIEDQHSALQGKGECVLDTLYPPTGSGWLTLNNEENNERYSLAGKILEEKIDGTFVFQESPIQRLNIEQIGGSITGAVKFQGKPRTPELIVSFETKESTFGDEKIELQSVVISTEERLEIEKLDVSYLSNSLKLQNSYFDLLKGVVSLRGEFSGIFQNQKLQSEIRINGAMEKTGTRKEIKEVIGGNMTGTASFSPIYFKDEMKEPWFMIFDKHEDEVTITREPDNILTANLQKNGSFKLELNDPLPLKMTAAGKIEKNSIEAELNDIQLDIQALNALLHIPYFDLKKGLGEGSLKITGSLTDPDFSGKLELIGGIAENPLIPIDIGPFHADFFFDGKDVNLPLFYVNAGEARVEAELDFIMDHWIPKYYTIDLESVGEKGVPMLTNFSRVYVDGEAFFKILIQGDFTGVDISGEITAVNTRITLEDATEPRKRSPFETNVDLLIRTGRQIEFLWPTENFPILQTFAEPGEEVKIAYNSLSSTYSVSGDVSTRSGNVFYFNRNFFMKSGEIRFNEEQGRFDPVLTARAELRDLTLTGETVNIILIVDEKPFSRFSPRFESEPPMANNEVLALLGQDIYTQFGGEDISVASTLAMTSNIILNQLGLMKSFESAIRDVLSLDLFTIRTRMLETLLADTFSAVSENESSASTLGRYLDNTTLFLGKYLSENIFLEAMVGLRLKQGTDDIDYTNEEFQIDTEVSLEWQTPLALLEFSFMPDMTDLFGTPPGMSLALSWSFSF